MRKYNYDYEKHYRKIKKMIDKNYGEMHLCGNCIHMSTCIRNDIQWLGNKDVKEVLMKKKAPFVKLFDVQSLIKRQRDVGFVAVYDCERFCFEGCEGGRSNEI